MVIVIQKLFIKVYQRLTCDERGNALMHALHLNKKDGEHKISHTYFGTTFPLGNLFVMDLASCKHTIWEFDEQDEHVTKL